MARTAKTSAALEFEGPGAYKIPSFVRDVIERCAEEPFDPDIPDLSGCGSSLVIVDRGGALHLELYATNWLSGAQLEQLEGLGASIDIALERPELSSMARASILEAWVPFDAVEAVADLPFIAAIMPPEYPEPDQAATIISEGVAQMNADDAQAAGINGNGVTVGAVSDGVTTVATAQTAGELPGNCPATPCLNVLGAGAGDEGTAMLELINDMAPGANLLFQGTGAGTAAHINALNALVAAGADVIAEDIPFDAEPAFQQGSVALAGDAIANAGVSLYSSAGNLGQRHSARVLATGTGGTPDGVAFGGTPTGCANTPDNVVAIAPGGDTTFDVALGAGGNVRVTLQWSEARAVAPGTLGQGGFTDINLYIMDAGLTQCLAQSTTVQANGQGDSIEVAAFTAGMAGANVKIVVDVQGSTTATVPTIDMRWRGGNATDVTTRAGSMNPDNNYQSQAIAVAAINAGSGAVEGFSGGGPIQLGLSSVCAGGGAPPCTAAAGPGVVARAAVAPDLAASDGTSVSGAGAFGQGTCPAAAGAAGQGQCQFFGTSAAAPHAAGCDALVRQVLGANAPLGNVLGRLTGAAVDQGPAGPDNITGVGLLDCFAALGAPVARCRDITLPANAACNSGAITAAQLNNNSSDPNGDPLTFTVSTAGPLGLGTTPVTLTVSDGTLTDDCVSLVTVVDQTPPTITAPADISITACVAPPLGNPIATDNCAVTITNNAPAKFPLLSTVVTWTATDPGGNTETDTQEVFATLKDDASCCPAGTTIIQGTAFVDVLFGTLGSDCILARGGPDTVVDLGGNDFISAGAGITDTVYAGPGNDIVFGNEGIDVIVGGLGNDTLIGEDDFDVVIGGVFGGNTISGGAGNDVLVGGTGLDTIDGEGGIDVCVGIFGDILSNCP